MASRKVAMGVACLCMLLLADVAFPQSDFTTYTATKEELEMANVEMSGDYVAILTGEVDDDLGKEAKDALARSEDRLAIEAEMKQSQTDGNKTFIANVVAAKPLFSWRPACSLVNVWSNCLYVWSPFWQYKCIVFPYVWYSYCRNNYCNYYYSSSAYWFQLPWYNVCQPRYRLTYSWIYCSNGQFYRRWYWRKYCCSCYSFCAYYRYLY